MFKKQLISTLVLAAFVALLMACGAPTTKEKLDNFEELNIVVKMFWSKCEKSQSIRDLKACDEIPSADQKHMDCVATVKGKYADLDENKHMDWLNGQGCPIKLNTGILKDPNPVK
jgi:hypothetical protein